jgi:hypothetical protein
MNQLPDPKQPTTAEAARQPALDAQAQRLIAAVEDAMRTPTSYRDTTPVPAIGSALPVPQPGIPPQSSGAVDYAVRVLSTGVATVLGSGGLALVLAASQAADPVVCGIVFGAPIGLAVPIAALSVFVKRWKQAAPDTHHHHHYNGNVVQDYSQVNTTTRGVWAHTRNQLPK